MANVDSMYSTEIKYREDFARLAFIQARAGDVSHEKLGRFFGVDADQIHEWRLNYAVFNDAFERGQAAYQRQNSLKTTIISNGI